MHHFIFPNQDTWISSGSHIKTGESFKDQNFGRDQILEVKKEFFNKDDMDNIKSALVPKNNLLFVSLESDFSNSSSFTVL